MKITNVEPVLVTDKGKSFCFVVVDTDEGISGIGESGISSREWAVAGAVRHLREFLVGRDPFQIERLWQEMFRGGFFPAGNITAGAIAAIDIALYDVKGKALNVPVYELLGGLARDKVAPYAHVQGDSPAALVEAIRARREEGWRYVRWRIDERARSRNRHGDVFEPRRGIQEAVEEFAAIRAALGDDIELLFDCHARLEPVWAVELCKAVAPYRPFWVEDPIRAESPYSLRHVRDHAGVPLAVGEHYRSKWEFREVIEAELADYARIDICNASGLTESKKIAGWCETHYIQVATHNPLGPVSSAACLQLSLAVPNVAVMEQPTRPGVLLPDVFPVQVPFEDGWLLPPGRPGLGIEFDREAAKSHPYQPTEMPHLRRLDGSVTNW
jgi:L-alanine-DL-glutamate epimerase-like enolase superfamily enzyme